MHEFQKSRICCIKLLSLCIKKVSINLCVRNICKNNFSYKFNFLHILLQTSTYILLIVSTYISSYSLQRLFYPQTREIVSSIQKLNLWTKNYFLHGITSEFHHQTVIPNNIKINKLIRLLLLIFLCFHYPKPYPIIFHICSHILREASKLCFCPKSNPNI